MPKLDCTHWKVFKESDWTFRFECFYTENKLSDFSLSCISLIMSLFWPLKVTVVCRWCTHTHTHRGWATLFFSLCQIWCNFSFDFESGLRLELAAGVQPFESKAKVVISVGRDHYGKSTGAFVLWGKAKFIPLSVFLSPSTFLSLFSRSILYLSAPSPLSFRHHKRF